jgi:predicted hydrocarbon binding protein
MKGIIFNLFEDFIVSRYGEDKYEEIIAASDTGALDPFEIVGPGSYPDEAFDAILNKASEKIDRNISEILKDMGRHSLSKLAERHPHFFNGCEHPRDFLKTASMIHHVEVRKLYQGAEVPSFFVDDRNQDGLALTYKSRRHLCHLVEGLIAGLGDHYKIAVSINQTECIHSGGQVCKFIVKFHEEDKASQE